MAPVNRPPVVPVKRVFTPLTPSENPRKKLPNHRERGPKKRVFTNAEIAAALDMTPAALKQAYYRGSVDLNDLRSIITFAKRR